MLLPPSGPRSIWTARSFRSSEENWLKTPWPTRRSGGRTASTTATMAALVEALKASPRKIGRENLAVILSRARSADRTPLTQPEAVSRSRTRRDEPRDLTVLPRDEQLERRALQQPIGLRPQHGADVRAGHTHVAVLPHDAQLSDAPGGPRAGHRDVRDALQAIAAGRPVPPWRARPRQYTAQLRAVPFLAPAKSRGEIAVVMPAAARVGDRPQVRATPRRLERLLRRRGAATAGGVEIRFDDLPGVLEHLTRRPAHGAPHLGCLARNAVVHLIADVRPGVEAQRFPATAVLQGEAARDHRLGDERLRLLGAADADLAAQHAGQVALHRHAVHHCQPGAGADHVDTPPVPATAHHREAVLGHAHGGDPRVTLGRGAARRDQAQAAGIGCDGPSHAGGDGADRLAVPIVRDEQLAIAAEGDAGRPDREPDPQLRLHARPTVSPRGPRSPAPRAAVRRPLCPPRAVRFAAPVHRRSPGAPSRAGWRAPPPSPPGCRRACPPDRRDPRAQPSASDRRVHRTRPAAARRR